MFCDNVPTRAEMNYGDGVDQSEFQCEMALSSGSLHEARARCGAKCRRENYSAAACEPRQQCTSRGDDGGYLSLGQSSASAEDESD